MKTRDELVKEVAADIVNNKSYTDMEWDSISVTVRFESPSIWEGGVVYVRNECIRKNPAGFDLTHRVTELRNLMKDEDGSEWLACLIKISALTQEVDIDFEYENVRRWYLTPTMDQKEIQAYLMSLR